MRLENYWSVEKGVQMRTMHGHFSKLRELRQFPSFLTVKTATVRSRKSYTDHPLFKIKFFKLLIIVFVFELCVFVVSIVICMHNAPYLKIAAVNCRGIRDRVKRLAIFTYARTLEVRVLCLQETFPKLQDEYVWQIDWGG